MIVDSHTLFGLTTEHLNKQIDGFYVNTAVQDALLNLQNAASSAGFELKLASSFRAFDRQLAIWNNKFSGVRPILDIKGNVVDISSLSDWQICQAILLYSALPGLSRHHWGTDFDFYDAKTLPKDYQLQLIAAEYQQCGLFAELTQWLQHNAKAFGFYFPYDQYRGGIGCEPWHISYHNVADHYLSQLTPKSVSDQLKQTNIQGQEAIMQNINEIFDRYVTNICEWS